MEMINPKKPNTMEIQLNKVTNGSRENPLPFPGAGEIDPGFERHKDLRKFLGQLRITNLDELLINLVASEGKKSFLVFKGNKYINVQTERIAFFYVKYESSAIACFDKQEYFVDYSLDQIQDALSERQFFRLNRQYLIN